MAIVPVVNDEIVDGMVSMGSEGDLSGGVDVLLFLLRNECLIPFVFSYSGDSRM